MMMMMMIMMMMKTKGICSVIMKVQTVLSAQYVYHNIEYAMSILGTEI